MGICGSTLNKKEKESSKLSPQSSPNELPENRTSDLDFPDVHSFDEPHPNKQLLEDLFNKHENPMLLINTSGTQIIAMNHAAMKKIGMFSIEDVFKKCLSSSQERPVTYHDFFNMLGRNREMAMDEEQQFPLHFPVEGASVEVLTSLRVSKLSSGFNVELMETRALVKRLERTIEHHRTLAHEGRNARSAAIAHLRLSQDHLSELHGTLDVRPSSPHRALRAQELLRKAAIEQELSLASEHYVALVENFLLSPEQREEFALCKSVNLVVSMMDTEGARLRITKAGILKSTDEYEIEGHKTLLMYTLVNLIQNAIKFTTPKRSPSSSMRPLEITISVDEEAGDLWFSVADTGIGMTKEQEARCLGTQAKRFNNEIQGSGSGLSSIRSALNKVGGHITVTSILGEGTLFKFKLPLVIKRKLTLIESFQPEGALQDNSDYSNLLILAVDDQKLNQRLFGKYFSTLRIPLQNIFIVSTAEEARLVFKRQRQLKRPIDVVFTDINLGEGDDGILLAESLRVDEKAHPELKPVSIFVISGSQCPQTIAVNGSFLKPMSMEKIKSAFHVVLNDSEMRRLDDAMEGMSPKQIPQGEEITFRVLY